MAEGKHRAGLAARIKNWTVRIRGNKYVNKYTVTLAVFAVWMLFFDSNSIVNRIATYRRKREIDKKIELYRKEIETNNALLEALNSDTETLERFARENYKMKKKNEDIYIVRE